eukprot:m.541563 g.541563  ORF g.541563 m.541563 type:complete len:424 (+) comp57651_c0_seq2:371-1642(+)
MGDSSGVRSRAMLAQDADDDWQTWDQVTGKAEAPPPAEPDALPKPKSFKRIQFDEPPAAPTAPAIAAPAETPQQIHSDISADEARERWADPKLVKEPSIRSHKQATGSTKASKSEKNSDDEDEDEDEEDDSNDEEDDEEEDEEEEEEAAGKEDDQRTKGAVLAAPPPVIPTEPAPAQKANASKKAKGDKPVSNNPDVNMLYKAMIRGDKMTCKQILLRAADRGTLMHLTAKLVAHDVAVEAGIPAEQTYGNVVEYFYDLTGVGQYRRAQGSQDQSIDVSPVASSPSEGTPAAGSPRSGSPAPSGRNQPNKSLLKFSEPSKPAGPSQFSRSHIEVEGEKMADDYRAFGSVPPPLPPPRNASKDKVPLPPLPGAAHRPSTDLDDVRVTITCSLLSRFRSECWTGPICSFRSGPCLVPGHETIRQG